MAWNLSFLESSPILFANIGKTILEKILRNSSQAEMFSNPKNSGLKSMSAKDNLTLHHELVAEQWIKVQITGPEKLV